MATLAQEAVLNGLIDLTAINDQVNPLHADGQDAGS